MKLFTGVIPQSRSGKWSIWLTVIFIVLLILSTTVILGTLGYAGTSRLLLITSIMIIAVLFISSSAAVTAGIISLKKQKERPMSVFTSIVISLLGLISLGLALWGNPAGGTEETIIKYFLESNITTGHYDVYYPLMSLPEDYYEEYKAYEESIQHRFSRESYNLDDLVTFLFKNNETPVEMSIPSSPENGYYIDYDEKYQSYFVENGGGWSKLRQENPEVRTIVNLSVPAYDVNTGIGMIHIGWWSDGLFGQEGILVFKYVFGRIIPVTNLVLGMS